MTQPDPMFAHRAPALHYRDGDGERSLGSSGSDTSAERARRESESAWRQSTIVSLLEQAGPMGMTVVELRQPQYGLGHHGNVSSALSNMHAENVIAALSTVRREKSGVYVLPEHVGGRAVRAFRGNRPRPTLTENERNLVEQIRAALPTHRDKGIMPLKPGTVWTLLAAFDRLAPRTGDGLIDAINRAAK